MGPYVPARHYHDNVTTDVSFEASISLWYCIPFLIAALIGLSSLAAGAGIGAIIAAAIAKHIFKHHSKDYDYDYDDVVIFHGYDHNHGGGYGDGYHRRRKGSDEQEDHYFMELYKTLFEQSNKTPTLKTFSRTKRSLQFNTDSKRHFQFQSRSKIKPILKKFKPLKPLLRLERRQNSLLDSSGNSGGECGGGAACEVPASWEPLERQVLRVVRAGDGQFKRLVPEGLAGPPTRL